MAPAYPSRRIATPGGRAEVGARRATELVPREPPRQALLTGGALGRRLFRRHRRGLREMAA
eukprot:1529786-Pyramimonas_sp.AAC.1